MRNKDEKFESEILHPRFWLIPWQVKINFFVTIACFVLLVVVAVQVQLRNQAIDDARDASNTATQAAQEASQASESVRKQVEVAITEQINSPQARQNTQDTRQRIINIERALCKGPCPVSPVTAPDTASTNARN